MASGFTSSAKGFKSWLALKGRLPIWAFLEDSRLQWLRHASLRQRGYVEKKHIKTNSAELYRISCQKLFQKGPYDPFKQDHLLQIPDQQNVPRSPHGSLLEQDPLGVRGMLSPMSHPRAARSVQLENPLGPLSQLRCNYLWQTYDQYLEPSGTHSSLCG